MPVATPGQVTRNCEWPHLSMRRTMNCALTPAATGWKTLASSAAGALELRIRYMAGVWAFRLICWQPPDAGCRLAENWSVDVMSPPICRARGVRPFLTDSGRPLAADAVSWIDASCPRPANPALTPAPGG